MAMVVRVKPEYNGKIAVQSSNSYNGIILSNNLSQETLVQIYNTEDELRDFLYTTYTTVGDSYAPSQIDPSLIHAYASEEITHNPAKTDYPANTVGKHLNETRGKIDAFDNAFIRPSTAPSLHLNFAGSRFWNPKFPFSRNSIGTYIDQNGLIKTAAANKPRFTHDPFTKESLGLLMEETRTNLITYSNDFSNASFVKNRCSVTGSTDNAPDGTLATKIVEDASNNLHEFSKIDCPVIAGTTYTLSVFLKAKERNTCQIALSSSSPVWGGNRPSVIVDLSLGQIINQFNISSSRIEQYANGWYRVSITQIASSNGNSGITMYLMSGNQIIYAGDGVSSVLVFGVQLEAGLNATSYIPTTSAAITRVTDRISITGTLFTELFPNVSEGTLFMNAKKADARLLGIFSKYITLNMDNSNTIDFRDYDNIAKIYNEIKKENLIVYRSLNSDVPFGSFFTNALSWKANDAQSYINSIAGTQDNDVGIPSVNQCIIGGEINTIIKSIAFWPIRMTDSTLISLTSQTNIIGKKPSQLPANSDLLRGAFVSPEAILRTTGKQEFSVDGTGASVTRNIRRGYDFTFEIVDSSGVTITAQPASSCTAGTDNALTFTAPLGKTLTYAITPVYEN